MKSSKSGICVLCKSSGDLCESHILPSFVTRWMKRTSVTGRIRNVTTPNIRRQDSTKQHLLCSDCEARFAAYEKMFAEKIFEPYVNVELHANGGQQGKVTEIDYEEWLLKFIISVQWRAIVRKAGERKINKKQGKVLNVAAANWREYLLETNNITNSGEHHLIFLQGIIDSNVELHEKVNWYILRCMDTTVAYNNRDLWVYSKIGPIIILTTLIPEKLKNQHGTVVHKKGKIKIAIRQGNIGLFNFILKTRPEEIYKVYKISKNQTKRIAEDYIKNEDKWDSSPAVAATMADIVLRKKRKS